MNRNNISGLAKTYNAETDFSGNKPHGSGLHYIQAIQKAIDENIPLYKNKDILEKISGTRFLEEIPDDLIGASREILAYLNSMDAKERKDSH